MSKDGTPPAALSKAGGAKHSGHGEARVPGHAAVPKPTAVTHAPHPEPKPANHSTTKVTKATASGDAITVATKGDVTGERHDTTFAIVDGEDIPPKEEVVLVALPVLGPDDGALVGADFRYGAEEFVVKLQKHSTWRRFKIIPGESAAQLLLRVKRSFSVSTMRAVELVALSDATLKVNKDSDAPAVHAALTHQQLILQREGWSVFWDIFPYLVLYTLCCLVNLGAAVAAKKIGDADVPGLDNSDALLGLNIASAVLTGILKAHDVRQNTADALNPNNWPESWQRIWDYVQNGVAGISSLSALVASTNPNVVMVLAILNALVQAVNAVHDSISP